ncbi:MAG: hypothetical protein IJ837_03870 [Clostridia bacterium]|nr:hypothetical protein [Clostridia bacterium]
MENKKSSSFSFSFILASTICSLLILGWRFGWTSGYGLITVWDNACLVISALLQILSFITIILILIVSIWGILLKNKSDFELKVGKFKQKSICEMLFIVFVCLAFLVFLFCSIGFRGVTFGSVLYLLQTIGCLIAYLILRNKNKASKKVIKQVEQIENKNTDKSVVKKSKTK